MDDKKLHRCFTFSEEQLKHLRSKKYKIDRMECFMSLVDLAEPVPKLVQISKTKQVEILAGQVMVDNTQLAKLWDKDRKTVPKLLDAMEAVGIFSSQEVEDNRIYTLHCLSGWYVDAKFVSNAFALKRNNDSTAIIHAEVPASKVIITEDPDDKKKDKEGSASADDKSNDSAEGNNPQTTGNVSHQSPQSNDSGNVGKSGADGNKSPSPPENNSPQSADSPSPQGEADGKQNEGSSMSRYLLSKEDSSHNSLTAIKDRLSTAIRSLTATTTRTATNSRLRTQECDLHRQTIPKDVYRYRTTRQAETTF